MKVLFRVITLLYLFLFVHISYANETPILYTTLNPKEPLAPAYLFNSHNSVGYGLQRG